MVGVKKILFVCTGNICRSPMAEGLFRSMAEPSAFEVRSAGLGAQAGYPPSEHARDVMREMGIDISGIRSQPVTPELVRDSDWIFVMTQGHLDMLLMLHPAAAERTFLLREFDEDAAPGDRDIADPIGGPRDLYASVRDTMRAAMPSVMQFVASGVVPPAVARARHGLIRVALGADHGGVRLKRAVRDWLEGEGYKVADLGTHSEESVDYPDFAEKVAMEVASHQAEFGVLVCKTGIGMSMAANRVPGIRAALVRDIGAARMSREHNDANVLCLAGDDFGSADVPELMRTFLGTGFAGGRHQRRIGKFPGAARRNSIARRGSRLADVDPLVADAIAAEWRRQSENIELIASENFTSAAVMEAQGSCLTNKYAEGYPRKRWYGGCENVDVVEQLAINRARQLFGADHANVQPHSGSQANMAVYFSVLQPGDRIMTMNLAHGGHLTHGHPMNFSGKLYQVVSYGVSPETEEIDYDELARLAEQHRPKMITAGASAYSRIIDFPRMRQIADSVGALLFVDMAHIAGLVAAGVHPSPVPHADFVTTTTHKTLRGPRGGLILCREKFAKDIDSLMFPGVQGGPLMHVIAAKAVCLHEALQPDFRQYQQQVARNAKALCEGMKRNGYRIVSGATDNHLMLVDLQPHGITGKDAQESLDHAGITVNKNAIPFDKQSPFKAGGIRLGSPAVTTRGFAEEEMFETADLIHEALEGRDDPKVLAAVREKVRTLVAAFPLPA